VRAGRAFLNRALPPSHGDSTTIRQSDGKECSMESIAILIINLALIAGLMTALWLISVRIRNASIVDVFWGLGFVLVSWTTVLLTDANAMRRWVIVATATLWGTRLAAYLAWRNLGKPEDYRYAAMRDRYGDRFIWVSALLVFGLQGLLMWIVSWPLQFGQQSTAALNWLDVLGVVLWTVGWLFETVGDWQLARFKRQTQHAGQVMDRGLWRYTRHPNYFGDFLVWWGFYLMAVASHEPWWTIVSPLVMSVLLMRVSGVTLLERNLQTRRPQYADYMRRTSAFFPWPPRVE
jgi:steroid 5-alpha reductase family enzyme